MKVLTYRQHCNSVTARNSAAYVYDKSGNRKYLLDGKYYSEDEFNEQFPIKVKIVPSLKNYKGENPDKTKLE